MKSMPPPPGAALRIGFLLLLTLVGSALAASPESAGATQHLFRWRPFLAPFHAVVLHFPIGFITMAFVLELWQWRRPSEDLRRVTHLTIWLSLITGLLSATFGILRSADGGYENHALELHRVAGLAVPVCTVATLVAQKLATRAHRLVPLPAYRLLLAGTVGLLVVAGHYGGNLTHGSKYLVENAPEFVRDWLDETEAAAPGGTPAAGGSGEKLFQEKVRPILETKCVRCHGAEKQKGGYRLDQPALALKGGESGKPAIVPGAPFQSHLVQLILEKPGSENIMPPDGKEPLTPEEIVTVIQWIRDDGSFGTGAAIGAGKKGGG